MVLICAVAIFVFGTNYYMIWPTNGNLLYSTILGAGFLLVAVLLKLSARFNRYWQIAYALFVADSVNIVSILFVGYISKILDLLGVIPNTSMAFAIGKAYDSLLVILTVLVLTRLAGMDFSSLLIRKGNLKWGLAIGLLVLFNFFTSALMFYVTRFTSMDRLGAAILWGAVFAGCNGFLEELWFRSLFIKKLEGLIGFAGAVVLTSIWFGLLHSLSVSYMPLVAVPVYLINTFTLGLACGYLMLKTNSIWGSGIIHAAADWFMFIALLAVA